MATAPINTRIMRRLPPTTSSAKSNIGIVIRETNCRNIGGYFSITVGTSDDISARASASVTPGARRATTVLLYIMPNAPRSNGVNDIGRYRSVGSEFLPPPRGGNTSCSGMTPMTA